MIYVRVELVDDQKEKDKQKLTGNFEPVEECMIKVIN